MKIVPYLFFNGRCEDALIFYRNTLGGTFELQRNDTGPIRADVQPSFLGKVMHAKFMLDGTTLFFASDGRDDAAVLGQDKISLFLESESKSEGLRLFELLAESGQVKKDISIEFWGGRFGIVEDRFGIEWMIAAP